MSKKLKDTMAVVVEAPKDGTLLEWFIWYVDQLKYQKRVVQCEVRELPVKGYPDDKEEYFKQCFLGEYLECNSSGPSPLITSLSTQIQIKKLQERDPDELDWLLWNTTSVCGAACQHYLLRGLDIIKLFNETECIEYIAKACFVECNVICCG